MKLKLSRGSVTPRCLEHLVVCRATPDFSMVMLNSETKRRIKQTISRPSQMEANVANGKGIAAMRARTNRSNQRKQSDL